MHVKYLEFLVEPYRVHGLQGEGEAPTFVNLTLVLILVYGECAHLRTYCGCQHV